MKNMITNERRESIRSLKLRLDHAKRFPDMIIVEFWDRSLDGRKYRKWFRESLNQKINRELDHSGRKFAGQYQIDQNRDRRIIQDRANNIIWPGWNLLSTPELKRRYPAIDKPEYEL